jgi:hypothetical protein
MCAHLSVRRRTGQGLSAVAGIVSGGLWYCFYGTVPYSLLEAGLLSGLIDLITCVNM